MTVFYIIMSVLWGVLMFLNSYKHYKWYICLLFVLSALIFWPVFVLIEVIMTAVKEFKKDATVNIELSDEQKRQAVIDMIRDNFKENE